MYMKKSQTTYDIKQIEQWLDEGVPYMEINKRLGKSRSTIEGWLKRNHYIVVKQPAKHIIIKENTHTQIDS